MLPDNVRQATISVKVEDDTVVVAIKLAYDDDREDREILGVVPASILGPLQMMAPMMEGLLSEIEPLAEGIVIIPDSPEGLDTGTVEG